MSLLYPDLSTLDEAKVQEVLTFLSQRLAEFAPDLETRRGALRDIVLYLESVFATSAATVIENFNRSGSLLAIERDTPGADSSIVDAVLSNFRISRSPGSKATGTITIVLDALVPVTIPAGMKWTSGKVSFQVDSSYTARVSEGSILSSSDRLIVSIGGGQYAFSINVTADSVGISGLLQRNASLVPSANLPHFLRAYAEGTFSGGSDAQTNQDLLNALASGMAEKSPSNRATTKALILHSTGFENTVDVSTVGFGDEEQLRYHSVLPVAFGGRTDVYVRTGPLPQSIKITQTATLLEKRSGGGVWQVSLDRDAAPGFYETAQIAPSGSLDANYEVIESVRGLDLTADGNFIPDLENAAEAAFSRFQTATIRFLDTDVDVSAMVVGVSVRDYDLYVRAMPSIKDLQVLLTNYDARPRASDLLVKAPVPCFVSLSFEISRKSGDVPPDLDAIKIDLAGYVGRLGFGKPLTSSAISSLVHAHLSSAQTMASIDMHGRILQPDGDVQFLHSSESLFFPEEPTAMVSGKTGVFYLNREDISVNVSIVS